MQARLLEVGRGVGEQHAVGRQRQIAHPRARRQQANSSGRSRRRSGSPPVMRSRSTPSSPNRSASRPISSNVSTSSRGSQRYRPPACSSGSGGCTGRSPTAAGCASGGRACRARASFILSHESHVRRRPYNEARRIERSTEASVMRTGFGLMDRCRAGSPCSWPVRRRAAGRPGPRRRWRRGAATATESAARHREITQLKTEATTEVDGLKDFSQQMVDRSSATASSASRRSRRRSTSSTSWRRTASRSKRAWPAFRRRSWRRGDQGKPVIALGSDIDGIPQASQKPGVAYHEPLIEGAPGHGEGHNSGQAVNITAALVLKKIMERDKIPGTIRIWPGVAEELVGTKAYLRARGALQGRRRRAVHARRQRPRRVVGRPAAAPGSCRCSTASRARARTPPARRGAAAARSTRWS